jgi:hypothetical protein
MYPSASPSPKKGAKERISSPDTGQLLGLGPSVLDAQQSSRSVLAENENSSEFGDADLDINFLETIEGTATEMVLEKELIYCNAQNREVGLTGTVFVSEHNNELRQPKYLSPSRQSSLGNDLQQASAAPKVAVQQGSDDEFPIEDDAAFATDMQDLTERYDTRSSTFSTSGSAFYGNIQQNSANDVCENNFDDDDDLWDEITSESFSQQRAAGVGPSSQVGACH